MTEKCEKCSYEEALDSTGFGKYNICMLTSCCFLILAMYLDIFGLSVSLPAVACDLDLTTAQQGTLTAVPLIGVMISSYPWGLLADTVGRRQTLLLAMPVGVLLNIATSLAPTYGSLAALKFMSAAFTSSANAAAFVLIGESVPRRHRSRFMFLMAGTTMLVQFVICVFALPIFNLSFNIEIGILEYRPWRLLMQVLSMPGILGILMLIFLKESPKFLLCKGLDQDAIEVLQVIYSSNTGNSNENYPVSIVFALPIFNLSFNIEIGILEYRPWRLLMQVLSMPGILGILMLIFLKESPKFLLCKGLDQDAIEVLQVIYSSNTGNSNENYPVKAVYLDETLVTSEGPVLKRIWGQTAPLFKPPLLKNSLMLYYILLCGFMTSTGYTMWVPTITNAYFSGEDSSGQTFCEVASQAASGSNSTYTDCDDVIQSRTLYSVMGYSGASGALNILLSFIVAPIGKKKTTIIVMAISATSGFTLLFVEIPILSIMLFYIFLYVSIILGNINTYLVELNPTYLRGMATCLSVVVARGLGFCSVQLIAALLASHCVPMVSGYVVLVISGLVVALFLPPDTNTSSQHKTT